MANIKSAKKRILTNEKARLRNKSKMSALKTSIKKAVNAIENKDKDAKNLYTEAVSQIDKAATKGLLHKNNAARKKSSLDSKMNKLS
ncbi:MAG: 30S ribosomal protein S20 [Clostridia bacterium]|nr:30S ribosomal protein S20 [Clostridia bacterium]